MKFQIPYGDDFLALELPDGRLTAVISPREIAPVNEDDVIRSGFETAIPPFPEFISEFNNPLIILNDATRPTPTARILKYLDPEIRKLKNPNFIIACGTHRGATSEEIDCILGPDLRQRYKDSIHSHDCRDDEMVNLGRTKAGTEVIINARAMDSDVLVLINSVEPHYFAGFTGGRKSIIPGIASHETIEKNHSLIMNQGVAPLALEGNPLHEDIMEAIGFLDKPIYSIQTVLSGDNRIIGLFAGELEASFKAAVNVAADLFSVPVQEKADIVIAVAVKPMDTNFLQAQKAIQNSIGILKDGGVMILVGCCRDGVGRGNFYDLMLKCRNPESTMEIARGEYRHGYHVAYNIAEIASRYNLLAVTDLPEKDSEILFLKNFDSVEKAFRRALELTTLDASIAINLQGTVTVPYVRDC